MSLASAIDVVPRCLVDIIKSLRNGWYSCYYEVHVSSLRRVSRPRPAGDETSDVERGSVCEGGALPGSSSVRKNPSRLKLSNQQLSISDNIDS